MVGEAEVERHRGDDVVAAKAARVIPSALEVGRCRPPLLRAHDGGIRMETRCAMRFDTIRIRHDIAMAAKLLRLLPEPQDHMTKY